LYPRLIFISRYQINSGMLPTHTRCAGRIWFWPIKCARWPRCISRHITTCFLAVRSSSAGIW